MSELNNRTTVYSVFSEYRYRNGMNDAEYCVYKESYNLCRSCKHRHNLYREHLAIFKDKHIAVEYAKTLGELGEVS